MAPHDVLIALAEQVRATSYQFVTPTPATHARILARTTDPLAYDLRGVFGWSRPFRPEIMDAALFATMREAAIAVPADNGWRSTVRFATLGGELFVHSAYPTTAADAVFFGPDTYRFCTAITAELADSNRVHRAVDICAGAGPGAVTIARHHPDAEILMVDINQAALAMSRVNAALAGLPTLQARHSDLLDAIEGDFDLVVANPPYLNDPAQRTYRHGGGTHGASLSLKILDAALPRLRPGGRLILYTGVAILDGDDPFLAEARHRLEAWAGDWRYREIDPDVFGEELETPAYADADRIAAVVLTVRR